MKRTMNKPVITIAVLIATSLCTMPATTDAQISINVDINTPPPSQPRRRIDFDRRPEFLYLSALGFSVSTGLPFDIVYYGEHYYIFQNGMWYCSPAYKGPWVMIDTIRIPDRIRMYRYDEILRFRDEAYRQRHHDNRNFRDYRRDRFELRGADRHRNHWP